ncbi:MAG: ArsC family reductase [Gammaproteobacteria bacterium]|nr:ArsC family reductase [Gammaproteobacteria bacterium]MDH5802810.1 ArsC family reductase [Gammaproteobacteria bacterium]
MLTLYGIKNCDTVRKARKWLDAQAVAYAFQDLREQAVPQQQLQQWLQQLGWETVVNRRGTTWRQLDAGDKDAMDNNKALTLISQHPALIKRPVLQGPGILQVGFSESNYTELLKT